MAESVLERRTYDAGQQIFEEGQVGNQAYIVQSGRVEIVKVMDDNETILGAVGEGGMFGEMALIDNKPRMATARAAEVTTLIFISRMMFEQKMTRADPFVRGLIKILVGNIRSLSAELERYASGVGELTET
ncbi:MAG: cyclic nucleotide-binding domain-containing protein, partial [Rhodospirillales bacterium]|nr:cyclic nucleotide-binding domain-containing protein [Rhodospirillales bacterium]